MKYFKLYFYFIKNSIGRDVFLRYHFSVNLFTVVVGYLGNIAFFFFLYNTGIGEISGWGKYEVYLLLATVWIVDSLFGGIFFFNLIKVPMKVRNYDLDYTLLKPVNSIFLISFREFNLGIFSGVFFGSGFLVYTCLQLGKGMSFLSVIAYLILIMCSVLILFSIFFLMITFSLRFIRIQGLIQMFWTLVEPGKKPYVIYPKALKIFFLFVIPALVIYNFPTLALMKTTSAWNSLPYLLLIALIITISLLSVTVTYFSKSIRYYYS